MLKDKIDQLLILAERLEQLMIEIKRRSDDFNGF